MSMYSFGYHANILFKFFKLAWQKHLESQSCLTFYSSCGTNYSWMLCFISYTVGIFSELVADCREKVSWNTTLEVSLGDPIENMGGVSFFWLM